MRMLKFLGKDANQAHLRICSTSETRILNRLRDTETILIAPVHNPTHLICKNLSELHDNWNFLEVGALNAFEMSSKGAGVISAC